MKANEYQHDKVQGLEGFQKPCALDKSSISIGRPNIYILCLHGDRHSETGCQKLAIAKYLGALFFKGESNIFNYKVLCIHLMKYGIMSIYNECHWMMLR